LHVYPPLKHLEQILFVTLLSKGTHFVLALEHPTHRSPNFSSLTSGTQSSSSTVVFDAAEDNRSARELAELFIEKVAKGAITMFGSDMMGFTYVKSPDKDGGTVRLSKQVSSRLSSSASMSPSFSVTLSTLLCSQTFLKALLFSTFSQLQVALIRKQRSHGLCTQGLNPFEAQSLHREILA
jgi:hypothetical protein